MKRRIDTLICLLVLFGFSLAAVDGPSKIEELEKRLENVSGLEEVRVLNELAAAYQGSDPAKALAYYRRARRLAEELDEPDELANALNGIGIWHHINARYRDALTYYLKALELEPRLKNKQKIPNVITNIGIVYWRLGNFQLSEQYHTRALELRKKLGYTAAQMGHTLNNLGLALQGKGEYRKALEYFHQALELQKQAGNKRGVAAALTNISNTYVDLKEYTTALKYHWQAIAAYEEIGYLWGVANSSQGVGRTYILMGQYDRALLYLESALETAKQINAEDVLRDVYKDLSRVYEARRNFKKAAEFHRQFTQLKRKLLEERNQQHVSVLKVKYETEKKEQELQLLRKTHQRETLVRFFLAAAVLLFLMLVVVLYFRYVTGKRLNRQLQLNEAKYRSLFEQAGDAILLMDGAAVVDCNQKTLELFHVTRDRVIGRTAADFSPPTQPDGRDSMEAMMQYINETLAGNPRQFFWRMGTDGSLFDVEVSLSRVTISVKPMIQAVVHDIGLHKRLEAERVKTAELETLGLLAGGIAHDFNNLLAIMQGQLEMAKMQIPPGHPLNTYASQVETASFSAEQLVEKFLIISESGFQPKETLPIDGLIRESVASLLKEANVGVECRFNTARDLWLLDYDKRQVRRLIRSVVRNALDAMGPGGEMAVTAANVEIDKKRYVSITISDNGEGIRPEHLPKIFDPYFTTRRQVTRKGLGMGLTTARVIVRRHHGEINITSEPGKGTTCRIDLPASQWIL